MTKTIEELQAQRIKELEEDRNDLCARIEELKATNKELENKLEVATDECVWFANKNHQLHADLDAYIDLANFWFNQSLTDDKEEIRKIDNIFAQRYEHMSEALYNILHTAQDAEKFLKLLKRYNPDL